MSRSPELSELNRKVTVAIFRAERLPPGFESELAFREVSAIEEETMGSNKKSKGTGGGYNFVKASPLLTLGGLLSNELVRELDVVSSLIGFRAG